MDWKLPFLLKKQSSWNINHIFILLFQSSLEKDQKKYTIVKQVGFITHCSEGEHTPYETVGCLSKKKIKRDCLEFELIYGDLEKVLRKQSFVLYWILSESRGDRMVEYLNKSPTIGHSFKTEEDLFCLIHRKKTYSQAKREDRGLCSKWDNRTEPQKKTIRIDMSYLPDKVKVMKWFTG